LKKQFIEKIINRCHLSNRIKKKNLYGKLIKNYEKMNEKHQDLPSIFLAQNADE
jgi:hypothetical protein